MMVFSVSLLILLPLLKIFYVQAKQVTSAVAFECGKPALYLTSSGWAQDASGRCLFQESAVVRYCQHVYTDRSLAHAVFSPVIQVTLRGWCHHNNTSCLKGVDELHTIQPWICTAAKSINFNIPNGCKLKTFGGLSANACHKEGHWVSFASARCGRVDQFEPIKPCIKSGSYLHSHFLGIKAVCCVGNNTDTQNHTAKSVLFGSHHSAKFREKEEFSKAKKVNHETLDAAKASLVNHLLTSEAHLTENDWIEDPEATQKAEDMILEDFRQNFVNLSLEAQQARRRLESAHQARVLDFMRQNEASMLALLDAAVSSSSANVTYLLELVERLLHVIENNRYHVLRRFDRLRVVKYDNTTDELLVLKERLRELDRLFNASLLKLNKVPEFKPVLLQRITQLRQSEYSYIESFARSMLVSVEPMKGKQPIPSAAGKAALDAEEIINRYRHHFTTNSSIDGSIGVSNELHEDKSHLTDGGALLAHKVGSPVIANRVTLGSPTSHAELPSKPTSPTRHNAAFFTTVIIVGFSLLFLVAIVLAVRFSRRRARMRSTGCSARLIEVDEVDTAPSTLRENCSGFHETDALAYWVPGGFENPSYTYANNLIR